MIVIKVKKKKNIFLDLLLKAVQDEWQTGFMNLPQVLSGWETKD